MCDKSESESESKSKFSGEEESLKIAEEKFKDLEDLRTRRLDVIKIADLEDLRTRGLDVIKYSRDFLKEIEGLILNGSQPPNEFQTFIDESIKFRNIKNKLLEFDLYIYYIYKQNSFTKDGMEIKDGIVIKNNEEIIRLMDEIKSMIDEFKNSIKEGRVEVKPKNRWNQIRNMARFLQQKCDFKITEGELSGGRLVRGSNEHIVQRNYREQKVAEKAINKSLHELKKEIYFMRNLLDCSNILEFHGYCHRSYDLSVILEWADYNLQAYLNDHILNPSEKLSIARGIASALDFCHEKKILHHDIRTSNVLLNEFLQPKLYNFRINEESTSSAPLNILRWSSPERIRGEKYYQPSEVYSFALVMWAILYQQTPFITITSKKEIKHQILDQKRPELTNVDGIPVEYQEIIKKSWSHNPSARQDMKTILNHLNRLDLENFSDLSDQDADDYFDFNSANIDPATATILKSKDSQYPSKSKEIEQGIEYHKDKKYEDSWNIFKEYCHLKPKDPHANFWVGFYYLKGHYVKKDIQEGLKYLKKASELQHPDAQYWYSLTLLNNSIKFENDGYETAMKYLRISALTNYKALEVLGRIVQTGIYGRKANYFVGKAMIDEAQNMKMINRKFSTT